MSAEPLVGEVYGFRCWDLKEIGLVGAREHVWDDGPQEASCGIHTTTRKILDLLPDEGGLELWVDERSKTTIRSKPSLFGPSKKQMLDTFEHSVANHKMSACSCGFYARYSAVPEGYMAAKKNPVLGIVSGWGEAVLADGGWRASRSRIVALVEPAPDLPIRQRMRRLLPFAGLLLAWVAALVGITAFVAWFAPDGGWLAVVVNLPLCAVTGWIIGRVGGKLAAPLVLPPGPRGPGLSGRKARRALRRARRALPGVEVISLEQARRRVEAAQPPTVG